MTEKVLSEISETLIFFFTYDLYITVHAVKSIPKLILMYSSYVKSAENNKSKFYFSIFTEMKFHKTLHENRWKNSFNVS